MINHIRFLVIFIIKILGKNGEFVYGLIFRVIIINLLFLRYRIKNKMMILQVFIKYKIL